MRVLFFLGRQLAVMRSILEKSRLDWKSGGGMFLQCFFVAFFQTRAVILRPIFVFSGKEAPRSAVGDVSSVRPVAYSLRPQRYLAHSPMLFSPPSHFLRCCFNFLRGVYSANAYTYVHNSRFNFYQYVQQHEAFDCCAAVIG